MNIDLLMVLGLLLIVIVSFIANKPRMDVVALAALATLPFTSVLTINEALAGFSDPNIVLIGFLFVLGNGLVRTGVAKKLGDLLVEKTGSSELRLIALLMIFVGALGAVMSTTAVTAIFIPVVLRVAQRLRVSPSRLMMPLSFAAVSSGMTTLIATAPNLVVNAELLRQGYAGFTFFSFTPFGLPVIIIGILYMSVARRWLAHGDGLQTSLMERPSLRNWIDIYKLSNREFRLRIRKDSSLCGKRVGDVALGDIYGVNILAIERKQRFSREMLQPTTKRLLLHDDVLLVDSHLSKVEELKSRFSLEELSLSEGYFNDLSQEIGMAETLVAEGSSLVGKTALSSRFRTRTGLSIIGLRRGNVAQEDQILEEELRVGDTLLVTGPWNDIQRLNPEESGVLTVRLPLEMEEVLPVHGRMYHALGCLGLVVVLMTTGILSNVHAAIIGCLLMGFFQCIDVTSAYRSIEWKTIILIVGMMPFAIALQRSGGIDLAVAALHGWAQGAGDHVVLAVLFLVTTTMTTFISNTATAILMAPVAIKLAVDLNFSPHPFAMIVCLAASTAFITPVASPVNMMVMTPGNYSFADFARFGLPFSLIVMVLSVILVPWLLPL